MNNFIKRSILSALTLVLAGMIITSFTLYQKPWEIPAKYKTMKNTVPSNATNIATGKALYVKHCKSCHGATGKGDGPKAVNLKTKIRSFSSKEFKAQKPGEIYYESYIGRNEMPNFESKIPDESDRWSIINYLMTL